MTVTTLQLTARDPIVARDGRPFGDGQGNRMHSLPWPLPSVVAGSLRTALVKANPDLDFTGNMPQKLMEIEVAGVFPTCQGELYLPAPNDAVGRPTEDGKRVQAVYRVTPQQAPGECDFPNGLTLQPVMLSEDQARHDFKPKPVPAWWPLTKYQQWLTTTSAELPGDWFHEGFLDAAVQETRDHVVMNSQTGASQEGQLFSTSGLNLTYLPRFHNGPADESRSFPQRFAPIELAARVTWADSQFAHLERLGLWHPLGGERRLAHWQARESVNGWECPDAVKSALAGAKRVRMVLVTPAIFGNGWKPGLESGPLKDFKLKLVGVSNGRWKAVSGWSLQPLPKTGQPGPKRIRRMVPAGSVYFFTCEPGDAAALAEQWLKPVSDDPQEGRDGFGLAVWGTW